MMARAKRIYILIIKVNKMFSFFSLRCFLKELEKMFSVLLSSFSINLLAFYHECRPLIGYATHVLFCDRYIVSSVAACAGGRFFVLSKRL